MFTGTHFLRTSVSQHFNPTRTSLPTLNLMLFSRQCMHNIDSFVSGADLSHKEKSRAMRAGNFLDVVNERSVQLDSLALRMSLGARSSIRSVPTADVSESEMHILQTHEVLNADCLERKCTLSENSKVLTRLASSNGKGFASRKTVHLTLPSFSSCHAGAHCRIEIRSWPLWWTSTGAGKWKCKRC